MSTEASYTIPAASAETVAPEAGLVHNQQHASQAVNHLIDFFRKPRWSALLESICVQTQDVEDVLFQVLVAFYVESAEGEQLDFLGKSVGERRANRADEDYRTAVRARMLVNRSDGKAEQLCEILTTLFPSAAVTLDEYFPASIVIELEAELGSTTLDTVVLLLRQAKLAGVRLDLTHVDAGSLIWASSDTADLVQGWGSDTDDTLGGDLSAVV